MSITKIVQIGKYYFPHIGGIETAIKDIAEGLCDSTDMNVVVFNEKKSEPFEEINKVKIFRYNIFMRLGGMPISFSYLTKVKRHLTGADIAILHMPFPWGDLALRLSGFKGKVLIWWHSDIVKQKKLLKLYKPLMKWTLNRADKILVATQGHIEGSDFLPNYKKKCCIVPFGVDEEYYVLGKQNTYKNKTYTISFLAVGRMVYYKGFDILLKAFAMMKNKNTELKIVGKYTDLTDSLKKLAKDLQISGRVAFENELPKNLLAKRFSECDVFVLSSSFKSEAFAIVQLDAMAFGKPVINTNLPGGVPYVSIDGKTGITVKPGDAKELACAMDKLASDRNLREKYSKAAFERVECFRRNVMSENIKSIIESELNI